MAGLMPLWGRDDERAELHALLQGQARLVTVLGLAGVGKTRLVEEVLGDLRELRPLWRVSLLEGRPAESILRALACDPGEPERLGRVLQALGPALLVLDAVEDCADELAADLPRWLAEAPELVVLLTSRRALGLAGEALLPLEPLREEAALSLLCAGGARVRRVLPLSSARALYTELGGLPAALEWAAAQLAVLSPEELLAVLQAGEAERAPWLRGLAWSIARLPAEQREGLLRLWAYERPLPAREAARVVGGLDILEKLRLASLLGPVGAEGRLHPYRGVGLLLEGDAWRSLREQAWSDHADAVLARGRELEAQLTGVRGPAALTELALLEPELAAVQRRGVGAERAAEAVALRGVLRVYGRAEPVPEAQLEELLEETSLAPASRASLLCERAAGRVLLGRVREALQDLEQAEPLAAGTRVEGRLLLVRGPAQQRAGDHAGASETAHRLLAWAQRHADAGVEVEALSLMAKVAQSREEHERLAREAVQLARARGNELGLLGPLLVLADAVDELRLGAQIAEQVGFLRASYYFHSALANRLAEEGEPTAASRHLDEAMTLARRNGWDRLAREGRAIYDTVRWSLDPAVDCRPSLRLALTDSRGEGNQALLLSFLYAAEVETHPDAPLPPFPERGRTCALCAVAAELQHAAGGPPDQAHPARLRAQHLLESEGWRPFPSERSAARLVHRALARLDGQRALPLHVGDGGTWFSVGEGPRISLARRVSLQRLLCALAEADRPLSVEALFAAGWPGQTIRAESAAHRVHVAVGELRKMGLGERLERGEGGYRLRRGL